MQYTTKQREKIIADAAGKTVEALIYDEDPRGPVWSYWVMTFTDGSEISFKFMSELIRP